MFGFDNIGVCVSLVSAAMLVLSVVTRAYLGNRKIQISDLFFIALAVSGFMQQPLILETVLFSAMVICLFKEAAKYQERSSKKIASFTVVAVNALVLVFIQTQEVDKELILGAVVWLSLTSLLVFPPLGIKQQSVDRIKAANLYHFSLRVLVVIIIHHYLKDIQLAPYMVYGLLGVLLLLALITLVLRKVVITKMVVQSHLSLLIILLSFVYPTVNDVQLLVVAALLYVMDNESLSLQSHNRRWINMLEWPVWLSPAFVLLITTVYGIKMAPLTMKLMFVAYIFVVGAISIFLPEKLEQPEISRRHSHVIITKSIILISAIIVMERLL